MSSDRRVLAPLPWVGGALFVWRVAHIKNVLLMTLVTIAFGGMATAVAFGIYSFGTWLFTFGRTFGIVSVCAITVVLLTVAVEVRLSMNR